MFGLNFPSKIAFLEGGIVKIMNNRSRKYDGPIRNRERTKLKLLNAVGDIIREKGYTGLRINKIVEQANVDRKTLYDCYGTVNNLVENYIKTKDYYMAYEDQAEKLVKEYNSGNIRDLVKKLLIGQLEAFSVDKEKQNILMWHLSEDNPILADISAKREKIGSVFLKLVAKHFEGTDIKIKAKIALLVSGIYFLMLYGRKNKQELFCEIDLSSTDGVDSIKDAIAEIVDEAFERAERTKS